VTPSIRKTDGAGSVSGIATDMSRYAPKTDGEGGPSSSSGSATSATTGGGGDGERGIGIAPGIVGDGDRAIRCGDGVRCCGEGERCCRTGETGFEAACDDQRPSI